MDAIREVIVTLYLAAAYAGGPKWVERANEMLAENASDPEIGTEAAGMLRVLSEQSKHLFAPPSDRLQPCSLLIKVAAFPAATATSH